MMTNLPKLLLKTSMGDITFALFDDHAPIGCERLRQLVADRFFDDNARADGKVFHRVTPTLLQFARGPSPRGPMPDESSPKGNLQNGPGTLGFVTENRTNTRDAELYINVTPNPHLDGLFVPVGQVVEGMSVVEAIAKVQTIGRLLGDAPLKPIHVHSLRALDFPEGPPAGKAPHG